MKFNRMFWQWIIGVIFVVWILFSGSNLAYLQHIFNIVGIFLLFCGIIGRLYATLYIGGMKNSGQDGNSFISDGVYRISRNPLYFFSFLAFLGLLFIKGQIALLIVGSAIYLIIYRFTILGEEKFLSAKFGEKYQEFLKSAPRFFPDFSKFSYPEKLQIYPHFLHKEIKRAFVWMFAAFLIYVISYFQNLGFIPVILSIW